MTPYQKELIEHMRGKGLGYKSIAAAIGISENTVKSYCKRNGIISSFVTSESISKEALSICRNCGKPLENHPKVKTRKYCSDECRLSWWNRHTDQVNRKAIYHLECTGCGEAFESYGNKKRKYCCHACYIKFRFGSG